MHSGNCLLLLILVFIQEPVFSQQKFVWSYLPQGTGDIDIRGLGTDTDGSIYALFDCYASEVSMPGFEKVKPKLNCESASLLKLSPEGAPIWIRTLHGSQIRVSDLAVSASGKSVITGIYFYSCSLEGIKNSFRDSQHGTFVAVYDSTGELLWTKAFHSNSPGRTGAIAVGIDSKENIYARVWFHKSIKSEGLSLERPDHGDTIYDDGQKDELLIKYDKDGKFLWYRDFHSALPISHPGGQVVIDQKDAVILTGGFKGSLNVAKKALLFNDGIHGDADAFIAKYSGDGDFQWVKQVGGSNGQGPMDIKVDRNNDIVVTGWYAHECIIGTEGTQPVYKFGYPDIHVNAFFLFKLSPKGEVKWAKSHKEKEYGNEFEGYCLTEDDMGNWHVFGRFMRTISIYSEEKQRELSISTNSPKGSLGLFSAVWSAYGVLCDLRNDLSGEQGWTYIREADVSNGHVIIAGHYSGKGGFQLESGQVTKLESRSLRRTSYILSFKPQPECSRINNRNDTLPITTLPMKEVASLSNNASLEILKGAEDMNALSPLLYASNNIVFLIDISSSMKSPDKLPLLKSLMKDLVLSLRKTDNISIVVYSSSAEVVLPSVPVENRVKITSLIDSLETSGTSNGVSGLQAAYEILEQNFIEGGNNQIILATDGMFNNPEFSQRELVSLAGTKAEEKVILSVVGLGNNNDASRFMKQLAKKGKGNFIPVGLTSDINTLVEEIKKNSSLTGINN